MALFVGQLQARMETIDREFQHWKQTLAIQPSSTFSSSPDLISLGAFRPSQSILPISLPNHEPASLGNRDMPFHELHLQQNMSIPEGFSIQSWLSKTQKRTHWTVHPLGYQVWGQKVNPAAQFTFQSRPPFTLQPVLFNQSQVIIELDNYDVQGCLHIGDKIQLHNHIAYITQINNSQCIHFHPPIPQNTYDNYSAELTNVTYQEIAYLEGSVKITPLFFQFSGGNVGESIWSVMMDGVMCWGDGALVDWIRWDEMLYGMSRPRYYFDGSVFFKSHVRFDYPVTISHMKVESPELVMNLNAEMVGGRKPPATGELVTTDEPQVLRNKTFDSEINMNGYRVTNVPEPLNPSDVVTKKYADQVAMGLHVHEPVRCASLITLQELLHAEYDEALNEWCFSSQQSPSSSEWLLTFDNVRCVEKDAVLVHHEQPSSRNGVYVLYQCEDSSWRLRRRDDCSRMRKPEELQGYYVWVENGERWGRKGFRWNTRDSSCTFHPNEPMEWVVMCGLEGDHYRAGQGLRLHQNVLHQNVDDRIFQFQVNGSLTMRDSSIQSKHMRSPYIDLQMGPGLWTNTQRWSLGEQVTLGVHYNESDFNWDTERGLSLRWNTLSQVRTLHDGSLWIPTQWSFQKPVLFHDGWMQYEESAPISDFRTEMRVQENETKSDHDVPTTLQYWIMRETEHGMTEPVPSRVYHWDDTTQIERCFVRLQWKDVEHHDDEKTKRVYIVRAMSMVHTWREGEIPVQDGVQWDKVEMVSSKITQAVDIPIPRGFGKLPWVSCTSEVLSAQKNRRCVSQWMRRMNGSYMSGGLDGVFQWGSYHPISERFGLVHRAMNGKSLPLVHWMVESSSSLSLSQSHSRDDRVIPIMQWSQISDDDKQYYMGWTVSHGMGKMRWLYQQDVILQTSSMDGMFIVGGYGMNWERGNHGVLRNHVRLQVQEGGISAEGGIWTQSRPGSSLAPSGFGTLGLVPDTHGTPALLQVASTTIQSRARVMDGIYFQENPQQPGNVEIVPVKDGKPVRTPIPVKQFTIQHPLQSSKYLQHACLEGPSPDVYQRFRLETPTNKTCLTIPFPAYWWALVDASTISVTVTPEEGWVPHWVETGFHEVRICWDDSFMCGRLPRYWNVYVIGKRSDVDMEPEPEKTSLDVVKWGPYSWSRPIFVEGIQEKENTASVSFI